MHRIIILSYLFFSESLRIYSNGAVLFVVNESISIKDKKETFLWNRFYGSI